MLIGISRCFECVKEEYFIQGFFFFFWKLRRNFGWERNFTETYRKKRKSLIIGKYGSEWGHHKEKKKENIYEGKEFSTY